MTTSPGREVGVGFWIRRGFVAAAAVDVALAIALHGAGRGAPAAWALAFAAAHLVAVGLVVGLLADAGQRLLPARRGLAPAAAFAVAWAAGFGVFVEDFSVFPFGLRVVLTAGAAVPFGLLALVWPRIARSRPLAAGAGVAAVAVEVGSHLALDGSYPGIHLAAHVAAGLLLGLALEGAPLRRPAARRAAIGDALLAVVGAASLVVWPPNAVLVALAALPTASVVPFLARIHEGDASAAYEASDEAQRAWFGSRAGLPAVPPTTPPLHRVDPIVVLLTVDALRADVVLGDDPRAAAATKNLRSLARRGASFLHARSPASSTSPSIAAMFTGKYYSSLYWTQKEERGKLKFFLPDETTVRFPQILAEAGVDTAYVVTAGGFDASYGVAVGMKPIGDKAPTARKVIPPIIEWLEGLGPKRGFVWSHILDAHHPYVRGPKDAEPYEKYLAEVADVDAQIGKLDAAIGKLGLRDRTYLVVSADHGEAFGEHGSRYHASTVYEEQVRIPMIVVGPGVKKRTIAEPVTLVDVGPTVLDLFGQPTPAHVMGQSLVPLLAGKDVALSRPIVVDAGRRKQAWIDRDGWKVIRNIRQRTTEAYDLETDPKELTNLVDSRPAEARRRLDALAAFFAAHELRRPGYKVPWRE